MFFLIPIGVDYRASRQPVVTFSIVGACILFFLLNLGAGLSSGSSGFEGFFFSFALIPSTGRPHTWITSLFMHAGLFHLLGNMIYLYLFGACVEDILGRGKFVGFYLLGGVVASLTHVLLEPMGFRSTTPLVGASGAISACMGAFAVLLRGSMIEFRFVYWFLFAVGAREWLLPAWLVLSLWFLDDVVGMMTSVGEIGGGVAFAAHVGGFLYGALVGAILRARGWRSDEEVAKEFEAEIAKSASPSPSPSSSKLTPRPVVVPPPNVPVRRVIVWTGGQQAGPFAVPDVLTMHENGTLGPDAFFWDEDANSWRPITELR